ncbi:MAG: hypothetical protein GXX08_13430 [Firmicutes bacterium]|nr:hypothetical protein [Bacillota bacterium]
MQRETGWEIVWDDEARRGTARDPEGEHPDGGNRAPQWNYKCERLNRRVQARYRQFPVNPPGGEAEPLFEQGMQGENVAEGEFLSQERRFDLEPGIEVDVEAAPIMRIDEMGPMGASDLIEPRQVGATEIGDTESEAIGSQPEPTGSEFEGRQGLRAIFATESDALGEVAGERMAGAGQPDELMEYAEQPQEPMAQAEWLGQSAAQAERPGELTAQTAWPGQMTEIPQAKPLDAGTRPVAHETPQGQIIWKSFPKPLRDKNK